MTKRHNLLVYALRDDWVALLQEVEAVVPLHYAPTELHSDETVCSYPTIAELPELGVTTQPTSVLSTRWLAKEAASPFERREVVTVEGQKRILCDLLANADAIRICPAGLYNAETIICGEISCCTGTTLASHKALVSTVRRTFTWVGNYFIGRNALAQFASGYRLTEDARTFLAELPRELIPASLAGWEQGTK